MGTSQSIHNDTKHPMKVWFALDGKDCPNHGCITSDTTLLPGSTTSNQYVQSNLSHKVCVKYAPESDAMTSTQTFCKDVTSPQLAGEHVTYNVGAILDTKAPNKLTPQADDYLALTIIALTWAFALTVYACYRLKKYLRKNITTVTFSVTYKTNRHEEVRVVGNVAELGKWDPKMAAPMKLVDKTQNNDPVWVGHVDLKFPPGDEPLEYKYVIMSSEGQANRNLKEIKAWEQCYNRKVVQKTAYDGGPLIRHDCWGNSEKVCRPPFWTANPMHQPLMGA